MPKPVAFESLLVPVDFSTSSRAAFDRALQLAKGEDKVIILMHAIDPNLIDFATEHGFGSRDEVVETMKQRASGQLDEWKSAAGEEVEIDVIVSIGVPFLEILRKAEDFIVDAVVMGKVGTRGKLEKLLFGSNAEKVLRACTRPVLVLPLDE